MRRVYSGDLKSGFVHFWTGQKEVSLKISQCCEICEIQKPNNHLIFGQMAVILSKTIRNLDKHVQILMDWY